MDELFGGAAPEEPARRALGGDDLECAGNPAVDICSLYM
jgi:hypothetical protein